MDDSPADRPENLPTGVVGDAIYNAAQKYGMDPRVLGGIASIESSFQPGSNYNKPTQYKGLFQIGHSEWNQYGHGNIYNAADNAEAAANMLADHANWFKGTYGRDPTPSELYMMHQQGRGFFSAGAMTNIGHNAYPGMQGPQDHNSFMNGWGHELSRRMNSEASDVPYVGTASSSVGAGAPSHAGGSLRQNPQTGEWEVVDESGSDENDDELEKLLKLTPTKTDNTLQPPPPLQPLRMASRLNNAMGAARAPRLPPSVADRLKSLMGQPLV